jgi:hypothetical protein
LDSYGYDKLRSYEKEVFDHLICSGLFNFKFKDGETLSAQDLLKIIDAGVVIPKIGERTELSSLSNEKEKAESPREEGI